MVSGDSGCNSCFWACCQPVGHHHGVTQFLPMGGGRKEKKKMSQHPAPSVNMGMFRAGAAGGRQGLATPLASCGRLAFQRTKHVLTASPQQSLPKTSHI